MSKHFITGAARSVTNSVERLTELRKNHREWDETDWKESARLDCARAGQQRHSSRHSLTFRPVGKGMPRRCTRCSATSAAAGGGVAGVLGSDGAAATRVRWAIAGLSFRFAAALLRVVASLADDGLVRLAA